MVADDNVKEGLAKKSTRQIIIDQAVAAFNERSYDAVSLHELAGDIGISRGNLTYHFKGKEELLRAITTQMFVELKQERDKTRAIPSFRNLHNEVQVYHKIQRAYGFIFLDTKLLSHPIVDEQIRSLTTTAIEDNLTAIALSISVGNMRTEQIKGTYHNLAFLCWMIPFFWYAQEVVRGAKSTVDIEQMLWSIIVPHFTDKGLRNFTDFFGESYLSELGPSFQLDAEAIISF